MRRHKDPKRKTTQAEDAHIPGNHHKHGGAAPVTWRCTRTEEVHCLRIGCSAPTNKNKRGTGTPNHSPPHPSMRSWALLATGWARRPRHHLHSSPLQPTPAQSDTSYTLTCEEPDLSIPIVCPNQLKHRLSGTRKPKSHPSSNTQCPITQIGTATPPPQPEENKNRRSRRICGFIVREGGVEPPLHHWNTDLNRARLPIPPLARTQKE